MLGTKLLWPGASKIVKCFFSVSNDAWPTSTVLPFSLSGIEQGKFRHTSYRARKWWNLTLEIGIQSPWQIPRFTIFFSCFLLVFFQCSFINHTRKKHNLTTDGRLPSIYNLYCISLNVMHILYKWLSYQRDQWILHWCVLFYSYSQLDPWQFFSLF